MAAALVLTCLCGAQEGGQLKTKTHAPVKVSTAPVTRAEASATFKHLAKVFGEVLHVSVTGMAAGPSPAKAVTRTEVISELAEFYRKLEPAFKMTMKDVTVSPSSLVVDRSSSKKDLVMLVTKGCVGAHTVLAVGSVRTLTVRDFGDVIGFFASRVIEMTHTPSTKWTPYLRRN
ncbi:MAG: hypothetical protein P4L46_26410 [Fimbriimonas sp.]|nr:hypothetical protein [Fimbriimonas sp.]